MSLNPGSIDLKVLFDTKEKAEQFIKKFAEIYKQDKSNLSKKFSEETKKRLNSSKPMLNYYALKAIYQSIIIPKIQEQIRRKVEKEYPGKSNVVSIVEERQKTDLQYLRKNSEYTRISAAYNVVKPDGELESSLPNGLGIGRAVCGTCGKEKGDEEKGWKLGEYKKKGVPKTWFCSQDCFDKFDWDNYGSPKARDCSFCQQQYQHGVYFPSNPGIVFCSERCARSWENEVWEKKNLVSQRTSFIAESLENLPSWNLLTDEEKQNFISQVSSSEPEQFGNIFQSAKKLISEKQKSEEDQTSGEGEETGENNSSDDNNSDTAIPKLNSKQHPQQNREESNKNLPKDIQTIANLHLLQAQEKAKQKIEKLLKDNCLSEQELDTKNLSGKSNWKDYLRSLDSSQKVAEFTYQMQQDILKKFLAKKALAGTEKKKPQDGWVKPIAILVLLLLVLSTLIIIVRQRRRKSF